MNSPTLEHLVGTKIAFSGNTLVVSDEHLLRRLNRDRLSPSTAKAMHACPARWVGEKAIDKKHDLFAATTIGTAVHTVFERLYTLPPASRVPFQMTSLILDVTDEMWPHTSPANDTEARENETLRIDWMAQVRQAAVGLFQIEDPRLVETRAVEFPVDDVDVNGVPFIGIIDRIDRITTEDRGVIVRAIDLKSGAVPNLRFGDDHGDQMRLYRAALEAKLGKTPDEIVLHYTAAGKAKKAAQSKARMRETLDSFADAWLLLKDQAEQATYTTSTGPLCGWCPLVNACPAAAKDGFTAKVAAPSAVDLGMAPVALTVVQGGLCTEVDPATATDPVVEVVASDFPLDPTPAADPAPQAPDLPGTPDVTVLVADPGTQPDSSAVFTSDPPAPQISEATTMTTTTPTAPAGAQPRPQPTRLFVEDKPYEDYKDLPNANGYAAIGQTGTLMFATRMLRNLGYTPTQATVMSLARVFQHVERRAQHRLTGKSGLSDGMNARMRGFLGLTIIDYPLPIKPVEDGVAPSWPTAAEWHTWMRHIEDRMVAYGQMLYGLLTEGPFEQPFAAICSTPDTSHSTEPSAGNTAENTAENSAGGAQEASQTPPATSPVSPPAAAPQTRQSAPVADDYDPDDYTFGQDFAL